MEIVKIVELLKNHRESKTLLEFAKRDLQEVEEKLRYNNSEFVEDIDECISGLSMQAPCIPEVPKSQTNKFSSVTENVAMNYGDELTHINEFETIDLKRQQNKLKASIKLYRDNIFAVEKLVENLEDKEQFIIDHFFFRGYSFPEIALLYCERFRINYIATRTLFINKEFALNKMQKISDKREKMCG